MINQIKNIIVFGSFVLLFSLNIQAQSNNKSLFKNVGARGILEPTIFPYYPVLQMFDDEDIPIAINSLGGNQGGIRYKKYYPNRNISYGAEANFNKHFFQINTQTDYTFTEESYGFTPFLYYQQQKVEGINFSFYELGLRYQYTPSTIIHAEDIIYRGSLINDFINPHRIWLYIGAGRGANIFNKSPRTGLSNIFIGAYLPIGNLDDIIKDNHTSFPSDLAFLEKSRTRSYIFSIGYSQLLDIQKNKSITASSGISYRILPTELAPKKPLTQFFPPLFNLDKNEYTFSGNFYLNSVYIGNKDSTYIKYTQTDIKDTVNLFSSQSMKIGYTLNLGNMKKFYDKTMDDYYYDKGIRFNFFVSAGLDYKYRLLQSQVFNTMTDIHAEFSGGLRVSGSTKSKIKLIPDLYLIVGGAYQMPLYQNLNNSNGEFNQYNLGDNTPYTIFAGIGYRNAIYFKAYYQDYNDIYPTVDFRDRLSFSIGLGF